MKKTIHIEGMSCQHCAGAVKKELEKISGMQNVVVDLEEKTAVIEASDSSISDEILCAAVTEAGYEVKSIEG